MIQHFKFESRFRKVALLSGTKKRRGPPPATAAGSTRGGGGGTDRRPGEKFVFFPRNRLRGRFALFDIFFFVTKTIPFAGRSCLVASTRRHSYLFIYTFLLIQEKLKIKIYLSNWRMLNNYNISRCLIKSYLCDVLHT